MLTRREFMRNVGATTFAVAAGLEGLLGDVAAATKSGKKRTITFEQAFSNPKVMGKYLHELLVEMFGENEVKKYINDVRYFENRETYFQHYPLLTETDREIAKLSSIVTVFETSRFGDKVKSDIVAFPDIFKTNVVKIGDNTISINSNEYIIKASLEHEFEHAKDIYSGIRLKNGAEINSNNFGSVNPEVYRFVRESRGYTKELSAMMSAEKVKPSTLLLGRIDETKRGYALTLHDFVTDVFQRAYDKINTGLLTLEEYRLMTGQLEQIKAEFPELLMMDQVRPLYQKFGR